MNIALRYFINVSRALKKSRLRHISILVHKKQGDYLAQYNREPFPLFIIQTYRDIYIQNMQLQVKLLPAQYLIHRV